MARWLHALQQFQFSIVHRPGRNHGNAAGLSRVPSSPCRQCTRPDCPPVIEVSECADQPFDSESTGSSEDADLVPKHSGEDWITLLDDRRLSRVIHFAYPLHRMRIRSASHYQSWISSGTFLAWAEVKGLCPELRWLWHHRNNLTVDDSGIIWRKRSPLLQLLVSKPGRKELFLSYHASLFGGHLDRNRTLARLAHRFYWSGMSDDVKEWLSQCVT